MVLVWPLSILLFSSGKDKISVLISNLFQCFSVFTSSFQYCHPISHYSAVFISTARTTANPGARAMPLETSSSGTFHTWWHSQGFLHNCFKETIRISFSTDFITHHTKILLIPLSPGLTGHYSTALILLSVRKLRKPHCPDPNLTSKNEHSRWVQHSKQPQDDVLDSWAQHLLPQTPIRYWL